MPIKVQMNGFTVDISGYLNFGETGMCLEVNNRIDNHTIIIRSSADCYFFPDLDFKMREVSPNVWHVANIATVNPKEQ